MTTKSIHRETRVEDPYAPEQYPDPAVCGICGVVYQQGQFKWMQVAPEMADGVTCPACKAIRDEYAHGMVALKGENIKANEERILALIDQIADKERIQYPLDRIIATVVMDDQIEICTTFEHLARRLAEELHKAFRGEVHLKYCKNDPRLYICIYQN